MKALGRDCGTAISCCRMIVGWEMTYFVMEDEWIGDNGWIVYGESEWPSLCQLMIVLIGEVSDGGDDFRGNG